MTAKPPATAADSGRGGGGGGSVASSGLEEVQEAREVIKNCTIQEKAAE